MPKNVHFTRNFEKRDETRNRDEKREVQNCRDPGKSSRRDETREKHYFGLSLQKGDSATSFQLFDFSFFLTFLVSFEFQVDFLPRMPSFENSSA